MPLTVLALKGNSKNEDEYSKWQKYHIAGNINEGSDVFGKDIQLPPINEG